MYIIIIYRSQVDRWGSPRNRFNFSIYIYIYIYMTLRNERFYKEVIECIFYFKKNSSIMERKYRIVFEFALNSVTKETVSYSIQLRSGICHPNILPNSIKIPNILKFPPLQYSDSLCFTRSCFRLDLGRVGIFNVKDLSLELGGMVEQNLDLQFLFKIYLG